MSDGADVLEAVRDPKRLDAVAATGVLHSAPEEAFDRLTALASRLLGTDQAFVSIVAEDRQFLKSCVGFPPPLAETRETPVESSFCQFVVAHNEALVINDARSHPLVKDLPTVASFGIVAYAGIPVRVADGQVVGTLCVAHPKPIDWSEEDLGTLRDLASSVETELELRTDRRRLAEAKERLGHREALFRGIVDHVGDILTILDEKGAIRFISPSVEKVLGWTPTQIVGQSALDLAAPEDRKKISHLLDEAGERAADPRSEVYRFRSKSGGWRDLEGTATVLPADSPLGSVVISSRDVTEERRLQEKIRLLDTAIEQAKEGVVITDAELSRPGPRIVYVNEAVTRMTGYEADELLGATPRIFQGPETDQAVLERLRADLRAGRSFSGSTVNYRKDGTEYIQQWNIAPVENEEGEITHFVSVQRDITSERSYQERLQNAVRARTEELGAARREVVERLALAAEYRDDDTGEHTRRVGRLAAMLAKQLGLATETVLLLELSAPLHDLGKIGIPDRILLKPGPLSDEERGTMQRHATIGAEILSGGKSKLVRTAETIARTHHERWDGTGYPNGLAGSDIPLPGRVVAVADAFDAMAHSRPYKRAWPVEKVLAEIESDRGKKFDPRVVDALLAIQGEIVREFELASQEDDSSEDGSSRHLRFA